MSDGALTEEVAKAMWDANKYSANCSWDFGKGRTHMLKESKDEWRKMAKAAIGVMIAERNKQDKLHK